MLNSRCTLWKPQCLGIPTTFAANPSVLVPHTLSASCWPRPGQQRYWARSGPMQATTTSPTSPWISLTAPEHSKSEVGYWPKFIPQERAESLFQRLLKEVPWAQYDITVEGKTYAQPRLVAYYAEPETGTYTYSKLTLQPTPFTPLLLELKQLVEDMLSVKFNSALMNYYRDGSDCMEWHADDETLYGLNPTIAILTFGNARDFHMRNMKDHSEMHRFLFGPGDVLVMRGGCQQTWEHTIPPNPDQNLPRISLTFRTIVAPEVLPAGS